MTDDKKKKLHGVFEPLVRQRKEEGEGPHMRLLNHEIEKARENKGH
jgi:hypothetical protein